MTNKILLIFFADSCGNQIITMHVIAWSKPAMAEGIAQTKLQATITNAAQTRIF